MACNNKTSALELHIEVNKQNLSTFSEKSNTSTLRLPTDPSWPKIPLRRSSNSTNDIIESPCVITLTGSPTKNCSIVRAITCQHPKPNKKYEVVTQTPKRLPGCVDPRFRRQILQKPEQPNVSCNMENNEQKTQLDRCIVQKLKKVEEDSQVRLVSENANDYISSYHDVNKLLEDVTKSMKESTDYLVKKGSTFTEVNYCTMASVCVANERDSIEHRSFQEQKQDVKIAYESDIKDQETVGNICTTSLTTSKSTTIKSMENKNCLSNGVHQHNMKNNDNIFENKNISCCDKHISDWIHNKEKFNLNISLDQGTINEISINKSHQNLDITDNIKEAKNDKNISNLNISGRLKTAAEKDNIDSCNVIDDHVTDHDLQRERSKDKLIVTNSMRPCTNVWKQEITKNKRLIMNELSTTMRNDKMLQKCIQTLALSEVRNKKYGKNNDENKENYRGMYINQKRKTALLNLSRKAKSFFRKKSRLAVTDSDCTLILPGPCRIKGIQSNPPKCTKFCSLRNIQTENSFEKLSSISLESQKLLNKNYWEYYIKPKRKIAITKSDSVEEKNKCLHKLEDCSPESRKLQRSSLLSCMINNTVLQDPVTVNGKSSSNPAMSIIPSMHKNICNTHKVSTPVKKIKQEKVKKTRKQLIGLKIIALLSIMMYVTVIFLPMIYDYFFDEEYDDYEKQNYIELTFQYIALSFEQIFNGIIDV